MFNQIISNDRERHGKKILAYNMIFIIFWGKCYAVMKDIMLNKLSITKALKKGEGESIKGRTGAPSKL